MLKLSKGCKIEYFRERRDQGESSVAKTLTHAPWLYTHSTHWAVSTGRAACLPCSRCQSWGGGLSDKTRVPHTYEVHNKDVLNPSDLNASQGPPVSNKGWGQSQEWDWWTRSWMSVRYKVLQCSSCINRQIRSFNKHLLHICGQPGNLPTASDTNMENTVSCL